MYKCKIDKNLQILERYGIIKGVNWRGEIMLYFIYILVLVVFALAGYAIVQIRLYGITVKDFWKFVEANQTLDKLYEYSKRFDTLSPQQQILYLREAEAIFDAFDKMPHELWEEEYDKYATILDKYKEIKMKRWAQANKI